MEKEEPELRSSYETLRNTDEFKLFIDAAEILGHKRQVIGSDYPAAMSVYIMAMRLTKQHRGYIESDAPHGLLNCSAL